MHLMIVERWQLKKASLPGRWLHFNKSSTLIQKLDTCHIQPLTLINALMLFDAQIWNFFLPGFKIQWVFNRIGWTLFHVHKPRHHTDLTNTSNTEPWWMSGKRVWGYMCQFGVGKTRLQQKRCRQTFETFETPTAILNSPLSLKSLGWMHHIIQIGLFNLLLREKKKT